MTIRTKVADVLSDSELALAAGADEGVQVGAVATVYRQVEIKDPDSGKLLGVAKRPALRLRVNEVQPAFCTAKSFERPQPRTLGLTLFGANIRLTKKPEDADWYQTVYVEVGNEVSIENPSPSEEFAAALREIQSSFQLPDNYGWKVGGSFSPVDALVVDGAGRPVVGVELKLTSRPRVIVRKSEVEALKHQAAALPSGLVLIVCSPEPAATVDDLHRLFDDSEVDVVGWERHEPPIPVVEAIKARLDAAPTSGWHVDLAVVWDEEGGTTRHEVSWTPGVGFGPLGQDDSTLEGMGTIPAPEDLPTLAIAVSYLPGRRLRFDFDSPIRPVTARLHVSDATYEPHSVGGGAQHFLEFNLERIGEL